VYVYDMILYEIMKRFSEDRKIMEEFAVFNLSAFLTCCGFNCWQVSPTFTSSSTRMAVGRLLFGYLCPLVETPVGHPSRGRRIRRIAWGIRSPDAGIPTSIYFASECKHFDIHVCSPRYRNVMILIVRKIIEVA